MNTRRYHVSDLVWGKPKKEFGHTVDGHFVRDHVEYWDLEPEPETEKEEKKDDRDSDSTTDGQ
jgi:hypothetical protein